MKSPSLRPCYVRRDGEVAGDVEYCAAHVEQAVDAEDDRDQSGIDADVREPGDAGRQR